MIADDRTPAWSIIHEAADRHGVTVNEIVAPATRGVGGRGDRVVQAARQDVAVELREQGWPLKRIGRLLGGRDHATVHNILKRAKARETASSRAHAARFAATH